MSAEWETDSQECLEADDDCCGAVEYQLVGRADRAWPRCQHHAQLRQERYEDSMEQYADTDVAPDWFDPSYAGESWDGE
jgi:hypothetical protein